MLWKPGNVQLKNVKNKNAGSYFTAKQVLESPAVDQAWDVKLVPPPKKKQPLSLGWLVEPLVLLKNSNAYYIALDCVWSCLGVALLAGVAFEGVPS